MKVLIDMNLSPAWVKEFDKSGIFAVHWSSVGSIKAPDKEILEWAKVNNFVVFTHDLDFGTLLAAYKMLCPSVIQVRTQDVSPENLSYTIISVLRKFEDQINSGVLITIDENKSRIRILPIP